ncbi:di-heme oxidoredictase family protein [Rhodopirellula europaea]|uniref:di-heme oxidoredictase family protein n=1 Tax=Rhodopirellula europaea TaxID=1263866 RepID=UPI003D273E03
MAFNHQAGLVMGLILTLLMAQNGIAEDAIAGRELFEREWEFVDRPTSFAEFEMAVPRSFRPRDRDREMGRGHRPPHRDEDRTLTSVRIGENQPFIADGLGPLHNAKSCVACHPGGGASDVDHNVIHITVDPRSPFFEEQFGREQRGGPRKSVMDFFPGLVSDNTLSFTAVVHDASTRPGYEIIRQRLESGVPGGLDPEWFNPQERNTTAIADQPVVAGRYETLDYYLSQRNSTPLYGRGLIEQIPLSRLAAVALSQARSSGGVISGQVAGKYGWRGQVHTLSSFVAGACATELGLNVSDTVQQADDPADPRYSNDAADISMREVADLTSYVAGLPAPQKQLLSLDDRKQVRRGEKVFSAIGCAVCHIADLQPARGIYSDLLLHDMGADLQDPFPASVFQVASSSFSEATGAYAARYGRDAASTSNGQAYHNRSGPPGNRRRSRPRGQIPDVSVGIPMVIPLAYPDQPQFPRGEINEVDLKLRYRSSWDAMQREWKTPPLWGVADSAPYLHDGRAKTLAEAILWHGGEASQSTRNYARLSDGQKQLLLAFLESLKAPLQ